LRAVLAPLARAGSPFAAEVPRDRARGAHWVEPALVGEVVYRRLTPDLRLRHTSWRGLRPDRVPAEVRIP
ncbi:DNA ligase, partial [Amycolatopsis sp. SID8362]|nr:DNA ligase [Amycolatopsis sp. SID8362]NED42580.1 DNA ligase [Amycolatopsis sp. SID8362]